MPSEPRYWFPAKRYGWGWGFPATWQGWVTLTTWLVVLAAVSPWLAAKSLIGHFVFVAAMVAILIAICWMKGEPPRWRWGR